MKNKHLQENFLGVSWKTQFYKYKCANKLNIDKPENMVSPVDWILKVFIDEL